MHLVEQSGDLLHLVDHDLASETGILVGKLLAQELGLLQVTPVLLGLQQVDRPGIRRRHGEAAWPCPSGGVPRGRKVSAPDVGDAGLSR